MRKLGNILLICFFLALLVALPSCREGLQAGMDSYTVTLRVSESKAIENPSISHISFTVSDGDGLEISSGWKEAGSGFTVSGLTAGMYSFRVEGGISVDDGIVAVAYGEVTAGIYGNDTVEIAIDTVSEGMGSVQVSASMPEWMPEASRISFFLYPLDGSDAISLGTISHEGGNAPAEARFSDIQPGRYVMEAVSVLDDGTERRAVASLRIYPGVETAVSLSFAQSESVDDITITASADLGSVLDPGSVSYEIGGTSLFLHVDDKYNAAWYMDGKASEPERMDDGTLEFRDLEGGSHKLTGVFFDGRLLGAGTLEIGFIVSEPAIIWPEISFGSSWAMKEGLSASPDLHFTYEFEDPIPIEFYLDGEKLTGGTMSLDLSEPHVASLIYDSETDTGYLQPEGEGIAEASFAYRTADGAVYRCNGTIDVHGIRIDYNGMTESPGDYNAIRIDPAETVTHSVRFFDKRTDSQVTNTDHLQMFLEEAIATFNADMAFSTTATDHTETMHTEIWTVDEESSSLSISYTNNYSSWNFTAWIEYRMTEFVLGDYELDFSSMETVWRGER